MKMNPWPWLLVGLLIIPASLNAENILQKAGFDQRLNETVPLDIDLRDEQGRPVTLGRLMDGKPAILLLAYYECPNLCGLVLEGLAESLKPLKFTAGQEYQVIAVSIDPRETPAIAAAKKSELRTRFAIERMDKGWHFLTGDQAAIQSLARSAGFRYVYDPEIDQYAHAAGIVLLTGEGRIARYFYGVRFARKDLRLGLVETADNRIGSPIDQLLLLCYDYDPQTGRYSVLIMNVLRLAGTVTVLALGGFVGLMFYRERRHRREEA